MLTLAAGVENLPLLTTIAAGFAAAWVLGLITHRIGLSPIVGYLLAGVVIGPKTPGFAGDIHIAEQLAEVGVILLMFGVGLHFKLKDLLAVKGVAVPGAIGQSLFATLATVAIFMAFGWTFKAGVVLGMAMAVASTVVLLRVLMDRSMLNTTHGHVAVGWLIVEDILTVFALVLVPMFAVQIATDGTTNAADGAAATQAAGSMSGLATFGWAVLKLIALVAIVFLAGSRVVPWLLARIAKLRSPELFTLTVLVLSVTIAVGSAAFFGASVALGAIRGYPARTALTVAIGLSQIGEFSFILGKAALASNLMPEEGLQVLVATAMISITLNPLLFGALPRIEGWIQRVPWLWRLLNARHDARIKSINADSQAKAAATDHPLAIIVGYGPVGRVVDALLRDAKIETVIVDMNIDTIHALTAAGRIALFGDAARHEILEQAGIHKAKHLIVTLPHAEGRVPLVMAARELNPSIEITVRARYLAEREVLESAGAAGIVYEEGEAGVALARYVLERRGIEPQKVEKLLVAIRNLWRMTTPPADSGKPTTTLPPSESA